MSCVSENKQKHILQTYLALTGCNEANVPAKFLLNFVKLSGGQLVPILFINKIAFGILLQVITKNVVLAGRREQNQAIFA